MIHYYAFPQYLPDGLERLTIMDHFDTPLEDRARYLEQLGIVIFKYNSGFFIPVLQAHGHEQASNYLHLIKIDSGDPVLLFLLNSYNLAGILNTAPSKNDIIEAICQETNIPVLVLMRTIESRKEELVLTRQLVMTFARVMLGFSLAESGLIFNKDHATAIHSLREIRRRYCTRPDIRILIDAVCLKFNMLIRDFEKRLFIKEPMKIIH